MCFQVKRRKKQKMKKMLVDEIKMTGYQIRGHHSKDELERIARTKNIELTYKYSVKKEGWMGISQRACSKFNGSVFLLMNKI